ncbi:minor capsid protein [Oceanobacillus alkalisoli]|uniref:minor capsid protein n=1 Tax=Oceanobacillus alkalisoli TaxID=2925113 RepID=UPI001EE48605|nr:minor capsid protein [Oceanobacillus alkalisoli]MCG5104448.1 minor capsid protein [Oceanobacillus alkalisoli]
MVEVNVNLSGVYKKMENQNVDRGRYAVANQALADMNQFVPMDEGILRQTATIDIDGTGINYNTPYANRMFKYYMYNYTTPGTGPRWDNKAKGMFMSDWINAFLKGAGW